MRFTKNLLAAAVLAVVAVPAVYAQSITVTSSVPKNSAAEAAAKLKTNPTATRFTPCTLNNVDPTKALAGERDQLAFTIKYDAGVLATATADATLKDVFLLLTSPKTTTTTKAYAITRKVLKVTGGGTYTDIDIKEVANNLALNGVLVPPYVDRSENLGGLQTEVLAGGNLALEGLETGLWSLTAIVADRATAKMDEPSTWAAWDTTTFMVGGPWAGAAASAGGLTTCQ